MSEAVAEHSVTLIPGDGSGPELVDAALEVLEALPVRLVWDRQVAGESAFASEGTPLPVRVLDSLRAHRVGLKGPITTPVGTGFRSVNVSLRRELDLYACVRPVRLYDGVPSPFPRFDLVIVRENTEDVYVGVEFPAGAPGADEVRRVAESHGRGSFPRDSAVALKPISRFGSERIARFAFEYARRHGRGKVTVVHKANILKLTDGLFLETAREVARGYPDIECEDRIVDALCMQMVQSPESLDVLLLPNLYGDIVSDLAAGLAGGLGIAPGANVGDEVALFEPTHGSAPSFRGSDRLNPTALVLSAVLMLRHLGEREAAERLEGAVARVLADGRCVTFDLRPSGPPAGTRAMARAIVAELGRG